MDTIAKPVRRYFGRYFGPPFKSPCGRTFGPGSPGSYILPKDVPQAVAVDLLTNGLPVRPLFNPLGTNYAFAIERAMIEQDGFGMPDAAHFVQHYREQLVSLYRGQGNVPDVTVETDRNDATGLRTYTCEARVGDSPFTVRFRAYWTEAGWMRPEQRRLTDWAAL